LGGEFHLYVVESLIGTDTPKQASHLLLPTSSLFFFLPFSSILSHLTMDSDHHISSYGFTPAEISRIKAMDLLYHRIQTAQATQEVILEESTPILEAARETIQVAGDFPHSMPDSIWGWPDVQVMASWDEFWDEESFYYCPSPDKACSLQSLSSAESIIGFNFVSEESEGGIPLESIQSDGGKHIASHIISSYCISHLAYCTHSHIYLTAFLFSDFFPHHLAILSSHPVYPPQSGVVYVGYLLPLDLFLSTCTQLSILSEYSILSLKPSFSSLRSCPSTESLPSSTLLLAMSPFQATHASRVIDPEDPDEGEDLDLPDSERPGLRPEDFGFLPPSHIRPRSPVPVTRAETITVTLGNWEHQVTVTKPNADYRDVPSPILQPGSPPQRPRKPSLAGFLKVPSRRDPDEDTRGLGILESSPAANNEQPFVPPSPALKIPERAVNFMSHPSNSDISVFNLGSPTQPLSFDEKEQQAEYDSHLYSASPSPPPHPRDLITPASGLSIMQSTHGLQSSSQTHTTGLQARRRLRHNETVRPPVILSVQVPQGNDVSWSAPVSPESKNLLSPGVVFQLDEELNVCRLTSNPFYCSSH
jgi:hypothetical protein